MNKIERERSSEFLMKHLNKKDITQQYLSELSGVKTHNVYHYLRGECFPNRDVIVKLGDVLGFTFDEFIKYVFEF